MTRNRTSWVMVWVLLPALAMVFLGCPKKKPEPVVDEIPVETKTVAPPPAEEVVAPPPVTMDDEEEDPLDSEDLQLVNDEAARRGFSPNIHFEFDKSDLSEDARSRLARNAEFLKEHPEFQVRIEGHCDERGTNEYNLALGQRRANTAMDYLASLGVSNSGQISTITYGEERPVCSESDESCWWRNRRAHMVITGRR